MRWRVLPDLLLHIFLCWALAPKSGSRYKTKFCLQLNDNSKLGLIASRDLRRRKRLWRNERLHRTPNKGSKLKKISVASSILAFLYSCNHIFQVSPQRNGYKQHEWHACLRPYTHTCNVKYSIIHIDRQKIYF